MLELITKYILVATLLFSPTQMQTLGVFVLSEMAPSPQTVLEQPTPSSEPTPSMTTTDITESVDKTTPDSILAQPIPGSESTSAPQSNMTPQPAATTTPEMIVEPTLSSEPTPLSSATPDTNQVKTTLTTIHKYTENDLPVEKIIVISDLIIGTKIKTADYALTLENKVLDNLKHEELLLNELDNTVTYTYQDIPTPEPIMSALSVVAQNDVNTLADPTSDDIKAALELTRDSRWVNDTVAAFDFGIKANPINGNIYDYGATNNQVYARININCFEITTKPDSSVEFEMSKGTGSSDGTRVVWNLGTITDTKEILTVYVKVKSGCVGSIDTDSTTKSSIVNYGSTTAGIQGGSKDFPKSSLSIPNVTTKFSFTVEHYLEDENGNFIKDADLTNTPPGGTSLTAEFGTVINAIDEKITITNYTYDHSDKPSFTIGVDTSKNVIKLYYKRTMEEIKYTVNHVVNGKIESELITKEVWSGDTDKTVVVTTDSLTPKTGTDFTGYKQGTIKLADGTDVTADITKVPDGAIINITYVKDSFSYTVEHWIQDADLTNYSQYTPPGGISVTAEFGTVINAIDEKITITNYTYDHSDKPSITIGVDTSKNVIKLYYKRTMEEIKYIVNHVVNGKIESETVTSEIWSGELDKKVTVTPESLMPKTGSDFTEYKQGTITYNGDIVIAGTTKVPNDAIITINYVKDRFAFTVEYWLIDASGNFTKSAKNDGHTDIEHTAEYASTVKANDHILAIEDYVYWYAEQDEIEISEVSQENLLKLVYFKDVAGKIENGSDSADGIPDAYQTKFTYRATSGQGFVTSDNKTEIYEYVTKPYDASKPYDPAVKNSKVKPKATGVLAQADATYEFSNWSDETGLIYATIDDVKNAEFVDDMILTVNFRKKQDPTPLPTPTPTPTQTPAIDTPDEPIAPEPQPTVVPTARPVPTVRPKPSQTPTASPNTSPTPSEKTDGEANDEDKGEVTVVPTSPSNNNQGDKTPGSKDKVTESDSIFDDPTPFLGRLSSWALINLISMILGAIVTLVLLFAKRSKEEENEENKEMKDEYMRKRRYKVVGSLAAVIAVIMFCLTENMLLKMVWIDKYTPFMILFLIINLISFYFGRRWHEVEDKEEDKTKSA